MEKITFTLDTNETAEFYVLEQTKLFGHPYILVTEESPEAGTVILFMKSWKMKQNCVL